MAASSHLGGLIPTVLMLTLGAGIAQAHIGVSPTQSKLGEKETYTLIVPTEGKSATTAVELDVPSGVAILSVTAPAAEYSVVKSGERITRITWQVNIPPGTRKELVFVAQNPASAVRGVRWNVHQVFADGSRADWIDPPPARPAPSTRFVAN